MSKCIDVSTYQKNIDYKKVKKDGVTDVLIRAGYGRETSQKDNSFEEHYKGFKKEGMKIGAYWYSYATDVADAKREAKACIACIKGKKFDMPIFYDMEETYQTNYGKNTLTEMAIAFCEELKKAGYKAGVYANLNWFTHHLDYNRLKAKYPIWLAQYNLYHQLKCDIWQYASDGKVNGIKGNVDVNKIFNNNIYTVNKKPTTKKPIKKPVKKSNEEIAKEVIAGKWGNGITRRIKLTKAGYNYSAIQKIVTEMLNKHPKTTPKPKKKTYEQVAQEVIAGKWGNGKDRYNKLKKAGYNPDKIQKLVNAKLK